jgi:DNA-binding transcriptional regulator YiaG
LGKIESTIKGEIQRLAKHEVRVAFRPLRKEVWGIRVKLSNLLKGFAPLDRWAKELSERRSKEAKLMASPEEVKASRITPDRIHRLRNRLGISQRELGILTGSSLGAVLSWEKGKFRPKGEKKVALVALRKLRKREVKKILAEKAEFNARAKGKRPEVKTRRKKQGKRVVRGRK